MPELGTSLRLQEGGSGHSFHRKREFFRFKAAPEYQWGPCNVHINCLPLGLIGDMYLIRCCIRERVASARTISETHCTGGASINSDWILSSVLAKSRRLTSSGHQGQPNRGYSRRTSYM
jgi:hypothetical protein